jgi:hypothetical protein
MNEIEIERLAEAPDQFVFTVVVRDARGESRHEVSLSPARLVEMSGEFAPEDYLEAAFRFLLDRESKEQILPRFDVGVIAQYFPEFPRELPHYLEAL